jgi:hypothetical protein
MRRSVHLGYAALVLFVAAAHGCAPSIRMVHQSSTFFERCHSADYDTHVTPDARHACWSVWLDEGETSRAAPPDDDRLPSAPNPDHQCSDVCGPRWDTCIRRCDEPHGACQDACEIEHRTCLGGCF